MFETTVREGVCRLGLPDGRWLSTGFNGGETRADAAYNVTVPEGFDRTDLDSYAAERRARAGFADGGPTLLTGVDQRHARRARFGPVVVVATAGVSNPAALPVPAETPKRHPDRGGDDPDRTPPVGTVNVAVRTTRSLPPGALASLLGVVVEAKTATLLARTGFTGTTSDAVVVGCDPGGSTVPFAGSATPVGRAARVCVRDAVLASLDSRYADSSPPDSVADAEYGAVADEQADVDLPS